MKHILKKFRARVAAKPREGPSPSRASRVFDADFYLDANVDVRDADMGPWAHFLRCGWKEGRQPHPLFDVRWYLECYPDVAIKGTNPFEHFVEHGWREGRQPVSGQRCDLRSHLDYEKDPSTFDPFEHLIVADDDGQDWSALIQEVSAHNLEEAFRLSTAWRKNSGRQEASACLQHGELLCRRGDFADAAVAFEDALRMGVDAKSPLFHLAECAIRSGETSRLAEIAERLEEACPGVLRVPTPPAQTARIKAFLWLDAGRTLEAFASFDTLIKENPTDDLVFFGRGRALLELGSRDEAFDDFWRARRIQASTGPAKASLSLPFDDLFTPAERELLGGLWCESGDRSTPIPQQLLIALSHFEPGSAERTSRLRLEAHALAAAGDVDDARQAFADISKAGPHADDAQTMLARIHVEAGALHAALVECEALLARQPDHAYACFKVLELNDRLGNRGTPLPQVGPSVNLVEIGNALLSCNRVYGASLCFEQANGHGKQAPERASRLASLARCYLRNSLYSPARTSAEEVLQLDSESSIAHTVLGTVCRAFGEDEAAVAHFRSAIAADPQDPWVYQALAALLDQAGQRTAALGVLHDGLAIHVEAPGIKRDYDRLDWLLRLRRLSDGMLKAQSTSRVVPQEQEDEFVELLRNFIDADWPVIGRDLAECRVYMDPVAVKSKRWPLHVAYGDLLVRCGNKVDGLGYYEEAHRVAAAAGQHEHVRPILAKIIAALEQLQLYERCISYLEQYVHGAPPATFPQEYRRLACYSAMLGHTDRAHHFWEALLNR
jgi:tetratricopeptide (TPR) repeat protein